MTWLQSQSTPDSWPLGPSRVLQDYGKHAESKRIKSNHLKKQNQKVIENICQEPYSSYGLTLQESPSLIGNNDDVPEDATAEAGVLLPQGEIDAVAEAPPVVNAEMLSMCSVCKLPVIGNIDTFLKGAAAGTDNLSEAAWDIFSSLKLSKATKLFSEDIITD